MRFGEKNGEIHFENRNNKIQDEVPTCLTKCCLLVIYEVRTNANVRKVQKCANLVELEKSCKC